MAGQVRATARAESGIIDPYTDRIDGIEIDDKDCGVCGIESPVHVGAVAGVVQMTPVTAEAEECNVFDMFSSRSGAIRRQGVGRYRALRIVAG